MANSTQKTQRQTRKKIENSNEQEDFLSSLASHVNPFEILQEITGAKASFPKDRKDFKPGESIEISAIQKKLESEDRDARPNWHEFSIFSEEKRETEKKIRELQAELEAIIKEVKYLVKTTQNIKEEVKNTIEQPIPKPGNYHLFFFEQVLEIIKKARMNIEQASFWLEVTSKRSKMRYWTRYKKHGSSFLLSADHYLTRSAG